jgi:hypothetical protein
MDVTPVIGLDDLDAHLDELLADPSLPLKPQIFDNVELQLTEGNIPPLVPHLLPKLTAILKTYDQDPAVLAGLAVRLLGPVPFDQALGLASQESLVQALRSPAPSANTLAMTVLEKAANSPGDVASLSAVVPLVSEFLRRWLIAPQVEVGEKGARVLVNLLDVDCELPPSGVSAQMASDIAPRTSPGRGMLWRRLFRDARVYGIFINVCSGRDVDTKADGRQLSLAQGRLLRILPRLAVLNFNAVSLSDFPLPVAANGPAAANSGLLQFAGLHMVDRRDMLMHLSLIDFFEALVSLMRVTEYYAYKVETIRMLLREATKDDNVLKAALLSLPDRTVPEEADDLRRWLGEIMPGDQVRIARHWG